MLFSNSDCSVFELPMPDITMSKILQIIHPTPLFENFGSHHIGAYLGQTSYPFSCNTVYLALPSLVAKSGA